ncbi:MAG: hypothetical protein LBJ31_09505 [Treponema sp.]|jgi:hypothetical protein|nr:hypothetical protein [Treponema sp.]
MKRVMLVLVLLLLCLGLNAQEEYAFIYTSEGNRIAVAVIVNDSLSLSLPSQSDVEKGPFVKAYLPQSIIDGALNYAKREYGYVKTAIMIIVFTEVYYNNKINLDKIYMILVNSNISQYSIYKHIE